MAAFCSKWNVEKSVKDWHSSAGCHTFYCYCLRDQLRKLFRFQLFYLPLSWRLYSLYLVTNSVIRLSSVRLRCVHISRACVSLSVGSSNAIRRWGPGLEWFGCSRQSALQFGCCNPLHARSIHSQQLSLRIWRARAPLVWTWVPFLCPLLVNVIRTFYV